MSELLNKSVSPELPHHRKRSVIMTIILVLLALVIIVGIVFVTDATVVRTVQVNTQATAVVHSIQTGQLATEQEQIYQRTIRTKPTYTDSLSSADDFWQTGEDNGNSCTFTSQEAYDVHVGTQQPYSVCLNTSNQYTNFVYQVHMKFVSNTWAGLLFRASGSYSSYAFSISPNGLYSCTVSLASGNVFALVYGRSATIHTGFNQDNTVAVIARDYTISLFVNGQFVDSVQDATFTQGAIGVYAGILISSPVDMASSDVTFSNVSVWTL